MDDARLVGGVEGTHDLPGDLDCLLDGEGPAIDAGGEGFAIDQLEHQGGGAAVVFEAVDRGDVRVVEGSEHPRLALDAGQPLGVPRELGRQDLDRDLATEPGVARTVDFAHAARSERREDLERPDTGTRCEHLQDPKVETPRF